MRASPSNQRAADRLAPFLVLGWLVLVAPAAAQQLGPPIPLIPPPSASSPNFSPPPLSHDDAVASEPLTPPAAAWNSGTPPRDPLPEAFWHGTSRAMVELLLARLPDTTSPALQSLERRLLLSPAAAPEGPDAADQNLAALRAAALLRLGEVDAARAVVAAIPEQEREPALPLAVAADAIRGDTGRACATVRETVRHDQASFWQTALITCQALQGEIEQARLSLQLLAEEQQGPQDEVLAAAVETLAGHSPPAPVNRADTLDPLMLRLLVLAHREFAPALIEALRPDLALCLALDDDAPPATRLAAAERAARYGALSPDRLRALYSTLTTAGGPRDGPVVDHAQHFAETSQPGTSAERIARIAGFADAFGGSQQGGFTLAARLVLPALQEIEPDPSLVGSAPLAARLLIAANDSWAARRWSKLVSGSQEHSLGLLLAPAAPREEPLRDPMDAQRPPLYVILASALGEPLAPTDWAGLPAAAWNVAGPPSPPAAAWLDLAEAARAKRIGETVLAAIMVASPAGTLSADPVALFTAVSGLRQVGLTADARRLAVEAALAAGL
jgi:hypothetical protein